MAGETRELASDFRHRLQAFVDRGVRFLIHAPTRLTGLGLVLLLGSAVGARSEPLAREEVPGPLAPWIDWVLRGHEAERCPLLQGAGTRSCLWPSRLELALGDAGGRFSQELFADIESWAPLPGDAKRWPQAVSLDGQPAPVVERGGRPGVRLGPGLHRLRGAFAWASLPQLLEIPPETGIVVLGLRGEPVASPDRDEGGQLWLERRSSAPAPEESRLELTVHRLARDEVPLLLTTRVELEVSGPAREVRLGPALPEGFAPLALESPLPARADPDGWLRVQVRPGRWVLELEARHAGPASALALPPLAGGGEGAAAWAAEEIWVFEARPQLRLATVEGGAPVDPQQTALPDAWKELPAYRLEPGQALRLVEKRRGDSEPSPDQLSLTRAWYLDFDGGGATVSDRIEGSILASSRLEMGEATALGRVAVNGRDQLITRLAGSARAGIEVPGGAVRIEADSRVEGNPARTPAVGWDHDVSRLSGTLELPPGWRLFHAFGVDRAQSTWLNRWTLLDLFAVMIASMACLRLWGSRWGALALVALALSYTEPGAPRWLWVAVLGAEALHRAVPAGRRFARVIREGRRALLALLVLVALPFAVAQVRGGLYPVLERPAAPPGFVRLGSGPEGAPAAAREELEIVGRAAESAVAELSQADLAMPSAPALARKYAQTGRRTGYAPDPAARITTGPGVPSWEWSRVELSWSGPVERPQELRLVLVPPWLNGALAIVRVALVAALVSCALGISKQGARRWLSRGGAAAAASALLALLPASAPSPARAELPSQELLDELRRRLLESPACQPLCASSPRLTLEIAPRRLAARLAVDVAAETAVPLPGAAGGWVPESVLVDGAPAQALLRSPDGRLWLRLRAGRHEVLAQGALPRRDSVELPLPLAPHRVEARAEGWLIQGIDEEGRAESSLQLTRLREASEASEQAQGPTALPPFVRVVRELALGLTWQVRSGIERVSPADTALVLEVPLLPGEAVTTPDVRVAAGRALVSLAPGVERAGWESSLEVRDALELVAPGEVPWVEVWRVDASPIWHIEASGIPAVQLEERKGRLREWRPWPGERVALEIRRPAGVAGPTLTLDASRLELRPGQRATDATLALTLRSSQGGQHVITLPEGALLQSLALDGRAQPIRQEGREVTLPIAPRSQRFELVWREPRGIGSLLRGAGVGVGVPGVNAELHVAMPASRWTLLVGGPRLGPAVLFWPLLAVLAALALGLARIPLTPLRARHWLLLGVGLSQAPSAGIALVAAWLLALGWRARRGADVPGRWFDLLQLALVALTLAALAVLFTAIRQGLLGQPEMQIAGNGSSASLLRWYQDRTEPALPRPWALSLPLPVYRLAMLAWALWIAQALVGWLRWGWRCFSAGELWRPLRLRGRVA